MYERPDEVDTKRHSGSGKKIAAFAGGVVVVGGVAGGFVFEASQASAAQNNGRNWYDVGTTFEHYGFDGKVDPIGQPHVHKTKGEIDTISGQVAVEVPNCNPVTYGFKVHPEPSAGEQSVTFTQPLYKDAGGNEAKVYPDVTDPKALQAQAAAICVAQQAVVSPSATPTH